jgi:PmbA protein
MSEPSFGAESAYRAAEQVRKASVPGPWDVYGERIERYEVHLNGNVREMVRAPITLEGVGLRVIRSFEQKLGVGFAATTDTSAASMAKAVSDAEATARYSRFPASAAQLPSDRPRAEAVESVDRAAWSKPLESVEAYVHALLTAFEGRPGIVPSFGSVHLTLAEATLANSAGLEHRASRTTVDLEVAVKAFGGPEGRPPGEYWVTSRTVQLDPRSLAGLVDTWCQRAKDVRVAKPPSAGDQTVVLPPRVLTDILPEILSYRLSGSAELRGIAPKPGEMLGTPTISIWDDGRFPYAIGTSAVDDEGNVQSKRSLVASGAASATLYDVLHASAAGRTSTGSGLRESIGYPAWEHFSASPHPTATTMVLSTGDIASDAEIAEAAGEGIWVDQLGYAFPDALSAAFGGEIRIGYRIRHGKIAEPLRGGTVGGVVVSGAGEKSLLNSIVGLGKRPELTAHLSCPTLIVGNMSVGGSD